MFIELVSGVKYPKITTVGLFFEATICGCFVVEPFFFCFFFCGNFFIFLCLEFFCLYFGKKVVSTFFSQCLVSRVKSPSLQSSLSRVFDCLTNSVFNPCSATNGELQVSTTGELQLEMAAGFDGGS